MEQEIAGNVQEIDLKKGMQLYVFCIAEWWNVRGRHKRIHLQVSARVQR